MYQEVNAKNRNDIERQIANLATQIKCIQGGSEHDAANAAERCRLLYRTIAGLERQLLADSNAIRNAT